MSDGDHLSDDSHLDDGSDDLKIKYEVPYKNATRDLVLSASASFASFLTALAGKMEIRITLLSAIGYIPSYKPKSPKPVPKLLEDDESYEGMMNDIEEYIRGQKQKNKGSGQVKPFCIRIIDTSGPGTTHASVAKVMTDQSYIK